MVAIVFAADVNKDENADLTPAAGTLLGYGNSAAAGLYGGRLYGAGWPYAAGLGLYGVNNGWYGGAGLYGAAGLGGVGIGGVYSSGLYGSGAQHGWNNGLGFGGSYGFRYGY